MQSKGISPLIAAIILIALVVAVTGISSTFFTGFTKEQKESIKSKSSGMLDCGMAWFEIDKDLVSSYMGKILVGVENKGSSSLSELKIVVYNSSGAFELDTSPDSMGVSEVKVLEASYSGEYILNKLKVTSAGCPGLEDSVDFTFSYQEDATETDCSNEFCDGNWSSYYSGCTDMYFNYTKPSNVIGALWKCSEIPSPVNVTIPKDCWDYDNDKLLLYTDIYGGCGDINFFCYNGSWKLVYGDGDFYEEGIYWNVVDS